MLTVDAGDVIASNATRGTIHWSFDSGSEAFDYLAAGESLTLTYNVQATDSSAAHRKQNNCYHGNRHQRCTGYQPCRRKQRY